MDTLPGQAIQGIPRAVVLGLAYLLTVRPMNTSPDRMIGVVTR